MRFVQVLFAHLLELLHHVLMYDVWVVTGLILVFWLLELVEKLTKALLSFSLLGLIVVLGVGGYHDWCER